MAEASIACLCTAQLHSQAYCSPQWRNSLGHPLLSSSCKVIPEPSSSWALVELRHVSWDCHMGILVCCQDALPTRNLLCGGASQKTELFKDKLAHETKAGNAVSAGQTFFWVGFESLYHGDLLKALEFAVGFLASVSSELYGRSAWFLRWKLMDNLHLSPRRDFHMACGKRA